MAQFNVRERSTPDGTEEHHVDKKPRLDEGDEHVEIYPSDPQDQLDAPVEVMTLGESSSSQKPAKGKSTNRQQKRKEKHEKHKHKLPEPYSSEDVISRDVIALLGKEAVDQAVESGTEWTSPLEHHEIVELVVSALASTGESLSVAPSPHKPWVVMTPFALPGETIRVRVYRHARLYSYADLLEVVKPNPELRDMSQVKCKYFGHCSGCQYQMLPYETQLDIKREVIVKAFRNFSDLPPSAVPEILPTIGSPLQYGYRTKITPHFDAPHRLKAKSKSSAITGGKPDWLQIGFNRIGTRHVIDIEECPIASPVLNEALGPIRENIIKNINKYKKGVSLLLRESLEIPQPASEATSSDDVTAQSQRLSSGSQTTTDTSPSAASEKKICVTDMRAPVRERVGDMVFEYTAGSFFQNNNSILVPLTSYVRDTIFLPDGKPLSEDSAPTHLVDAYCGSGLFSLTLSPHFQKVAGIELSAESIRCATNSARLNNVPPEKCTFLEGDAANIFATVQEFPRDKTVLIIDPPRKGTDEKFIDQLIAFGCEKVVYVSCNVHTQARDVGMILRKSEEEMGGRKYVVESVRGFDLFPQTAHVESVTVLRLV